VLDDYARLPMARHRFTLGAPGTGFIQAMDTQRIGVLAVELGAGRMKQDDTVDPGVGLWFRNKLGDRVEKGDVVVEVLANDPKTGKRIAGELGGCFLLGAKKPRANPLIVERVGAPGETKRNRR
jgi:pyrimidine-nucleoside phosphorylase/thymidine phosphorylase